MKNLRYLFGLLLALALCIPLAAQEAADPALEILHTANTLYNRGLHGPAKEQYELFLQRHGSHARVQDARLGKALCQAAMGERKEAMGLIRELAGQKDFARREEMRRLLATLLLQEGDTEGAMREAKSLAKESLQEPIRQEARVTWCEAAFLRQDWTGVLEAGEPPANARMRYQLGFAQHRLKKADAALATLAPFAKEPGPFSHNACLLMARIQQEKGDSAAAQKLYHRAAFDSPGEGSADAAWSAALLAFQSKDNKLATDALERFRKDFAAHPRGGEATVLLGRAYESRNDRRRARELFAEGMKTESVRHEAATRLLRVQENDGDRQRVLKDALAWETNATWTPFLLWEAARIDLDGKRAAEAEANLRVLVKTFPQSSQAREAQLRLIGLLESAKRPKDAAEACADFARLFPDDAETPALRLREANHRIAAEEPDAARAVLETLIATKAAEETDTAARLLLARLHGSRQSWKDVPGVLAPLREKGHGEALFLSGGAHARLEQWPQAIAALARYLEGRPDEKSADAIAARLSLAQAYEKQGEAAKAVPVLEAFVQANAKDARAAGVLLKISELQGGTDAAKSTLEKITREYGNQAESARAWMELARLAQAKADPKAAIAAYEQLLRTQDKHELAAAARLQAGLLSFQAADYNKAREHLAAFLQRHPQDAGAAQAIFLLGMTEARREQWAEADKRFGEFLSRSDASPNRAQALYEQAWTRRKRGQDKEAVAPYRALLDQYPNDTLAASARGELADLLRKDGQTEAALALLESISKDDPLALLQRAWIAFDAGDFPRAATLFENAAAKAAGPEAKRDAWFQSGEASLRHKDAASALRAFAEARKLAEPTASLALRLAEAQGMNGQWRESEASARDFLARFPKDELRGRAAFQVAWALENQGRIEDAIAAYRAWTETGDKSPTAGRCQFQIAECLLALGRNDAAIAAYMQVILVHPSHEVAPAAYLQMADTLRRTQRPDEAKKWYGELVAKHPDSPAAALARKQLENP